ncbi:MAG: hypothetical protein COS99_07780 [Candidatus Omnitrophica bacterium CG07_land_8_20_14_0_80_42_15]|uniref:Thioredoxin domain-containing protein n=1 Tax=Candidatus Aquitaenariimonas noxiae TaxID=1974741 RepID=A0A2J0L137_9BACT|nr:MAG: hypothetical protein COS99_07780 [Candidatus Omnitrophica bacterium CG07_land_8_20_14_0_80_42_15]
MKRLNRLIPAFLAATLFASFFLAKNAYAIYWKYNLESALIEAGKEGKPILIDFYTEWCGWCKKLDTDVYPDEKVRELSREFICVKIDGDKSPELTKKYIVRGYPTIVFINSSGRILERFAGYTDAANFAAKMESVLKRSVDPLKDIKKKLSKLDDMKKSATAKLKKKMTKNASPFELSGIMYDKNNPTAVINDDVVKVGDTISGAKVTEITEAAVKLYYKNKEIILGVK